MKEVNPLIDKNKSVISIRGLKKAFDEFEVLRGVDLDLYRGENLVVLGRSGTGKSVFPLVRNQKDLSRSEIDARVESVLEAVGLLQTRDQMPSELSGGQRKRIGIARTLILKPEIMLYDEPTAGLDPITSIEINNLINEVQQKFNTSSIIITHDLTCARTTGDRIVMLLDGQFQRQGSFAEVFDTDEPRVKAFYDYNFID